MYCKLFSELVIVGSLFHSDSPQHVGTMNSCGLQEMAIYYNMQEGH